ncbi:MAG: phosphotransferase [Mycoplasmoidaceae bacterium]|nr:phosphotransferase [Mycoplasmoidaceae bacterium]
MFFINKIYNKIQKLHAKPVNEKVLKHDFFSFLEKTPLTKEIKEKYLSLLVQYKDEPLVMSHNDLNPDNILLLPNTFVYFIDFE